MLKIMLCERCQIIDYEHYNNLFVKRLPNVKDKPHHYVSLKLVITAIETLDTTFQQCYRMLKNQSF